MVDPRWFQWAGIGMFGYTLYWGYTVGGFGGSLAVWIGAGSLLVALSATDEIGGDDGTSG